MSKDKKDAEVEPEIITDTNPETTTDTNAGEDAISGTIADQEIPQPEPEK